MTVSLAGEALADATGNTGTNAPEPFPKTVVYMEKQPAVGQSVPVSDTPVTRVTIQDAAVRTVKDTAAYASDTFMNEFTARKLSSPYFRGIGSSPNNPGVTTYYDGVPQLNAKSSSLELVDMDQVEFVRGAQGALYGRNTLGGLISVTSRPPSLSVWRGAFDMQYGSYNYYDERLAVSGPLVADQLGLSLAGGYSARDGYTINDATGHRVDNREGGFGKAQLLWAVSASWTTRKRIFSSPRICGWPPPRTRRWS